MSFLRKIKCRMEISAGPVIDLQSKKKLSPQDITKRSKAPTAQPKEIKSVWDSEKSVNRYAIVFNEDFYCNDEGYLLTLNLSANPQYFDIEKSTKEDKEGRHLGKKITWKELPEAVRNPVVRWINDPNTRWD